MSGHWPPEWGDPEEEFSAEADQLDTEAEARLSEVAAYLASVPVPAMPDAVESRISATLAAEAAARAGRAAAPADPAPPEGAPPDAAPADGAPADGARKLGPSRRAPVRRHRRGDRPRRGFRVRPSAAAGALVACLLLSGLGYAIAHSTTGSTFSNAPPAAAPAASSAAAGSGSRSSANSSSAGVAPEPAAGNTSTSFSVTASGTKYEQVTLPEQVRAKLTVHHGQEAPGGAVPSAASTVAVPSPALQACVLHLTGGTPPRLVDRATYQGEPAYIVASSTRVWVVGLGCTAAKTELIVSVALAGLRGNLRALISVEQ
jgi:hypothetical protein